MHANNLGRQTKERASIEFDGVLDGIRQLNAELRPQPLERLVPQVGALRENTRTAAFNELLAEIRRLPALQGAPLLEGLVRQIQKLPIGTRKASFESVSRAVAELSPTDRIGTLEALAEQVGKLEQDERVLAVESVIGQAEQLSGDQKAQVLIALARQCDKPPKYASAVFQCLRPAVAALPPEHRAEVAVELAVRLPKLLRSDRLAATVSIIEMTNGLPGTLASRVLATVATNLSTVPESKRSEVFGRVVHKVAQLSASERRAPISALERRLEYLPPGERLAAFRTLADPMIGLATRHLLWRLSFKIKYLPDVARGDAFDCLFDATRLLTGEEAGWPRPLDGLCGSIRNLLPDARSAAFDRVIGWVGQLPDDSAGSLLYALIHEVHELRETEQSQALDRIVANFERLPPSHRIEADQAFRGAVATLRAEDRQVGYALLRRFSW
ncbi:hypothetical protein LJR230_002432 [Trinickia sp. LjRoot230]|uniref:hypothetical protein n=1 Tax=Trinickia sp. LjRoot230 TaxID=3342288 RepID=UPI003ECFB056